MKKNVLKKMLVGLAVCCAMLVPVGCRTADTTANYAANGAVAAESYESYAPDDYGYAEYVDYTADSAPSSSPEKLSTNRKLIKSVSMDVETEHFNEFIGTLETKISLLGGYVAQSDIYFGGEHEDDRCNAYLEIRVPEKYLEAFLGDVGDMCNVVEKSMATDDVTLQYVDTQGQKNMYLAEEQSLLALLEKAETLEDITYLNSRLSEVRYNIENIESRLRTYDNLVEYATIKLDVKEVIQVVAVEEEEPGFWTELGNDFMTSLGAVATFFVNLFRIFVVTLPYLVTIVVFAGIFVLAIKIIKAIMKKKNKNNTVSREE